MERVCIFIDGANFYHLVLKKMRIEEADFDFDGFVVHLANGREICELGKRLYVGSVPEKEGDLRTKEAMAKQTSLFTVLKKALWEIKTSKLKRRLEEVPIDSRVIDYQKLLKLGIQKIQFERLREKGVDVKLATDLIVGAVDNQYDTAVVISSDSDLIPAIDWVRRRKKKKVEYVGFSIPDEVRPERFTNPVISMITKTDIKRILVKTDLRPFTRYTGTIIEESVEDPDTLKRLNVQKTEKWEQQGWTAHTVRIFPSGIEKMCKSIKEGPWYMHFWNERNVIVAFRGRTFQLNFDDKTTWKEAVEYGRAIGIPEEQLDFPIS